MWGPSTLGSSGVISEASTYVWCVLVLGNIGFWVSSFWVVLFADFFLGCMCVCIYLYLPIYLSIHLSVYLSIMYSIYIYTYIYIYRGRERDRRVYIICIYIYT